MAITRGVEAKQIIKDEKSLDLNNENENQNLKSDIEQIFKKLNHQLSIE